MTSEVRASKSLHTRVALMISVLALSTLLTTSCGTDWTGMEKTAVAETPAEQAEILDPDVREAFLDTGESLLPVGSTLDIKEETLAESEPGYAEVEAAVTGPVSGRYLLRLTEDRNGWLIFETVPLQTSNG